nr:MAG TPA: hypothetical protein [Caudoviricetes sp.]
MHRATPARHKGFLFYRVRTSPSHLLDQVHQRFPLRCRHRFKFFSNPLHCCIDFTLRLLGRVFFSVASEKVVNRNIEILCQLNGILISWLCIVSCTCFGSPIAISRFRNASFS